MADATMADFETVPNGTAEQMFDMAEHWLRVARIAQMTGNKQQRDAALHILVIIVDDVKGDRYRAD